MTVLKKGLTLCPLLVLFLLQLFGWTRAECGMLWLPTMATPHPSMWDCLGSCLSAVDIATVEFIGVGLQ